MTGCVACLEYKWELECERCEARACADCQKQFNASPQCMGCGARFSKRELFAKLGAAYCKTDKFKREYVIKYLSMYSKFDVSTELLKDQLVKKLYDSYRKCSLPKDVKVPGAVDMPKCASCDLPLPALGDHVCNEADKASFELIKNDTRVCPKCDTRIYRTEGCDHIHCTNCNAKFCWITGEFSRFRYVIYKKSEVFGQANNPAQACSSSKVTSEPARARPSSKVTSEHAAAMAFCVTQVKKTLDGARATIADILKKWIDQDNVAIKKIYAFGEKHEYMEAVGSILTRAMEAGEFAELPEMLEAASREHMMPLVAIERRSGKEQFVFQRAAAVKSPLVHVEPSGKEPVTTMLDPQQEEHCKRVLGSLRELGMAFDCSRPGSGKTYVALRAAEELGVARLLVLCPKILVGKWSSLIRERNSSFSSTVVSYSVLAGRANHQPRHGLLQRVDAINKSRKKVKYYPTFECDGGSMLVVDEGHQNLKNSALSKAVGAIVVYMRERGAKLLNISGTPLDTKKEMIPLIRKLGFIHGQRNTVKNVVIPLADLAMRRGHSLAGYSIKYEPLYDIEFEDLCDLVRMARANVFPLDKMKSAIDEIVNWRNMYKHLSVEYLLKCDLDRVRLIELALGKDGYLKTSLKHIENFAWQVFCDVIKPMYMHAAEYRPRLDAYCVTFELNEREKRAVDKAFEGNDLKRLVAKIRGAEKPDISVMTMGQQMIERALLDPFIRTMKKMDFPKMVVCIQFVNNIHDAEEMIESELGTAPLTLNGGTRDKEKVIEKFQSGDLEHRVLILSPLVASCGIDLDDKHGGFRRLVMISPAFSAINLCQLMCRFSRVDSKSAPLIYVGFSDNPKIKTILDAKNGVLGSLAPHMPLITQMENIRM